MLAFGRSEGRDVESLQNWLDGNGCLAREETAYLTHRQELVSLAPAADSAVLQLEAWVEDKLIRFYSGFRSVSEDSIITAGRLTTRISLITTISPSTRMYISIPGP